MTIEREMLEYAAKACGRKVWFDSKGRCKEWGYETEWNPLTNSADCAAMCAKLEIDTVWEDKYVLCRTRFQLHTESYKDHNNDREAAWRYAATMVAARISGYKDEN